MIDYILNLKINHLILDIVVIICNKLFYFLKYIYSKYLTSKLEIKKIY